MREILFRGKRIDNGEWVYGSFLRDGEAHKPLEQPELPFSDCYIVPKTERDNVRAFLTKWISLIVHAHHVLPESIGQYTGLTDKNGQRIFEGDIIKMSDGEIGAVAYSDDCAGYELTRGGCTLCLSQANERLVIGNIHENPDLLKEEWP